MAAHRTGDDFHLMFCHLQAENRQLMNLSTFFDLSSHLCELTVTGSMDDHLIGCLHELEGVSRMTSLPPIRLAPRCMRLSLPFEAVTRRRLVAVVAIFCQPPLSLFTPQPSTHHATFPILA